MFFIPATFHVFLTFLNFFLERFFTSMAPSTLQQSAASWVKKVGGAGSCNFPIDTANFRQHSDRQLREIMGAQNLNFVAISAKCGFQRQILHFWTPIFRQ